MLIRFSVENFMSFREEIELSMVSGKSRKHAAHVVSNGKRSSLSVLRSAVIYGANASGKSNLIKAMDFAKQLIVKGTRPAQRFVLKPFRFDTTSENKPSKFEFEFKHKSKSFNYGFTLDTQSIHTEWLYEVSLTSEKPIFERTTEDNGETTVVFSNIKFEHAKDREFLEFTARGTRPNQLFLTETIERNVKYFEDVFNWFDRILVIIFPQSRRTGLEIGIRNSEDFQQSFENFLQLFDTGISGIDLAEFNFDEETSIPVEVKSHIKEDLLKVENKDTPTILHGLPGRRSYLITLDEENEFKAWKLMTVHRVAAEDRTVSLEVNEESDGTQRLFDLIPALMELLNSERVFVIDELDRSLHPHLSYKILELFLNNKPQLASQLIVTTHESSLLNLDLLRRDEIWFIEKNTEGASSVYSLEEFAPRNDKDIRKGYLYGRYGAIPFIKSVENLGWLE